MIKNANSLKAKVKNYSKITGVSTQLIIQSYMFERFLERLSQTKYKYNFVIKGGCLLSSIMGISSRTTTDMDINITGLKFNLDTMTKIINEIIDSNIGDDIRFEVYKVDEIKEGHEYSGYRYYINGYLENLNIPFHIDVSTGDIMTPESISYSYKKILEDGYIDIRAYNYETILAEKLQSILKLKLSNSRMKDYYDIYFLIHDKWNELNLETLLLAIHTTFENRGTPEDLDNIEEIMMALENDIFLKKLWKQYQKSHQYAVHIKFEDTIASIKKLSQTLFQKV